jgi:uroporphyrinogen decarboxylase
MTSRERVLAALRHEEPDRVPIDFGGMRSTGIMAIAYARLKEYLGLSPGQIRVYDMTQQLAEVEPEVLERFGVDVIDLTNSLGQDEPGRWKPWILPDGTPCYVPADVTLKPDANGGWTIWTEGRPGHIMPADVLYFTNIYHPLADATTPADLAAYQWPRLTDETLRDLQRRAETLYKHTQFAIMASFGGNVVEYGQSLRGWEQFMLDLADEDAFIEDLLEHIVETHLANLALFLEAVGDYVQIIQVGDDLGMQDRLLMSPTTYRRLIKSCHRRIYSYIHQHSDCYVFLHSCGSIYPVIPDLIEIGVDILNPVQTSAADMDPQRLKAEFGDRLTFWGGGCDTQQVITNAPPAEIAAHVAERLGTFAPGGGYVFNQVHNIQADVPPENVVAVYDTARQADAARRVGGA